MGRKSSLRISFLQPTTPSSRPLAHTGGIEAGINSMGLVWWHKPFELSCTYTEVVTLRNYYSQTLASQVLMAGKDGRILVIWAMYMCIHIWTVWSKENCNMETCTHKVLLRSLSWKERWRLRTLLLYNLQSSYSTWFSHQENNNWPSTWSHVSKQLNAKSCLYTFALGFAHVCWFTLPLHNEMINC